MTDELNQDFLAFSEMLDQEEKLGESTRSLLGDDGALLLALRAQLRKDEPAMPSLEPDFARTTAAAARARLEALPRTTRWLLAWEPAIRAEAFSKVGAGWAFGLSLLGLGALSVSWNLLGTLGSVVLLASLGLSLLYRNRLPLAVDLPSLRHDVSARDTWGLFYLIPTLAAMVTAGLVGRGVGMLGEASLSFQASAPNLKLAGIASVLVVFVWLYNACWPLWSAYEQATRQRLARSAIFQGLHCLWLLLALVPLLMLLGDTRPLFSDYARWQMSEYIVLACVALTVAVVVRLSRRPASSKSPASLAKALRRSFVGFLVGAVPIVTVLLLGYQASLTRELTVEPQMAVMKQEVEDWLAEAKAIPAELNGWTELEPIFRSGKKSPLTPASKAVADRLKGGSVMIDYFESKSDPIREEADKKRLADRKIKAEQAKVGFLHELPLIESVVAKPQFSHLREGIMTWETPAPNFILARSVSQGLQALVLERLEAHDGTGALGYMTTNLRWSTRFKEGGLISLMISVAMRRIAISSVQELILEGDLTGAQLKQLQDVLKETAPERGSLRDTMLREAYLIDQTFSRLVADDAPSTPVPQFFDDSMRMNVLVRLAPKSFWASERMVYLNLQLGRLSGWETLGRPDEPKFEEILPLSPAVNELTPNSTRAQVQFLCTLSRFSALQTMAALERYKREHGDYPARLESLVPGYLEEVPVDPIHPNLWKRKPGFVYQREGKGYRLLSRSSLYETIGMKAEQSYGPDGNYEDNYDRK